MVGEISDRINEFPSLYKWTRRPYATGRVKDYCCKLRTEGRAVKWGKEPL